MHLSVGDQIDSSAAKITNTVNAQQKLHPSGPATTFHCCPNQQQPTVEDLMQCQTVEEALEASRPLLLAPAKAC
jgi:hypothetical protein